MPGIMRMIHILSRCPAAYRAELERRNAERG